jgi:phosphoglycerol transferase MdoB-like AlkP superfamily enzyme
MKFNLQNKDIYKYAYLSISLIFTFWFISVVELYLSISSGIKISNLGTTILFKFLNDFWSALTIGILLFPLFFLINFFRKKGSFIVIKGLLVLLVIIQFSLVKYSLTTLLNLGADILGYSFDDIFSTVSVSESISVMYFFPFVFFPLLLFLLHFVINKYINERIIIGIGVLFILLFGTLKLILPVASNEVYQNKIAYLTKDIVKFQKEKRKINAHNVFNREDYPLLKPFNNSKDVLSSFLNSKEEKPNIVFIVVEGLGSEFVNKNGYSGFTPYLDSLISKSLYWENFVSTTGRSFGILPSLFGSLPYGEKGFLELSDVPSHISLISVLKANGYHTSYYSGGPSSFDRKINFLEYNGVDKIIDENKYGPNYTKTNSNDSGFSWGYPDKEIFSRALSSLESEKQPRLDIIITLSGHEPFEYPKKDEYMMKVENMVNSSRKYESIKDQIIKHKDIFGSLLYTDEAIKEFMEAYVKRPDYSNTIFIITGDHRLIPIAQKDKLCRFHVPFLIYSPMLKKAEKFKSVSSHWDVTPSLLTYLINNFKFKKIENTPWMGKGLDTVKEFRNVNKIPLMRYKGSINDFIYKDYFYSGGELFKINENFGTYKVKEEELTKTIADSLMEFKKMNAYVTQRSKIFPDSLNIYIKPKIEFSEEQLAIINKYANEKTFDEVLFVARDLSFNKQYDIARLLSDYILNEYPNYTDARILKGRTLAWEQDYIKSEKVLLNALKRSPYYDDAYLAILDMYWWSGQEEKSIQIFAQALSNDMINSEISFKMAKAYKRMDNFVQATKLMDSIIQKHPNNSDYLTFKETLK